MSRVLGWRCNENADVIFSCTDAGTRLPIGEWARLPILTKSAGTAMPGLLLAMQDVPGVETIDDGQALKLSPERVVALEPWQTRAVGLPAPPDSPLRLERHGLFTDRDFSLTCGFVAPNGQTLPMSRRGPIVT